MHVWALRSTACATVGVLVALSVASCTPSSRTSTHASTAAPSTPGSAQTAATPSPDAPVFPGARWQTRAAGDWSAFDDWMRREASSCVVVVKDGRIVHEAYYNGGARQRPSPVYSITKSMTALLVGTAAVQRHIGLRDRPVDRHDVTVRSLLGMTSGWAYSAASDAHMIRTAADKSAYALSLGQQGAVDSLWQYNNASYQLLEPPLRRVAPKGDVVALAHRALLGPLGMESTSWARDSSGGATLYSGVHSTCRDIARVGHLMLHGGRWGTQQIVDPEFVAQMVGSRAGAAKAGALNAAYGLGWWTNHRGKVTEVRRHAGFAEDRAPYVGRLSPSSPRDAVWALGYGQQILGVFPKQRVVAVRLGRLPSSAEAVSIDRFSAEVLAQSTHR